MEDDQWLGLKGFDLRREPQYHSEKSNQEAKGPKCGQLLQATSYLQKSRANQAAKILKDDKWGRMILQNFPGSHPRFSLRLFPHPL